MLSKIKYVLNEIIKFLLCLISSDCEYSIKKFLAYFFTMLIFYLVIFTDKDYTELLIFLGVLLGMREYAKAKYFNTVEDKQEETKRVVGFNISKDEKG